MQPPSWKQRIERIPILGNVVSGLAGVYTLRVWRSNLREHLAQLTQRADEASIRLQEHAARLAELEARTARLEDAASALRAGVSRLEENSTRLEQQGAHLEGRSARLADSVGVFELSLNRMASDLALTRRDMSRLNRHVAVAEATEAASPSPNTDETVDQALHGGLPFEVQALNEGRLTELMSPIQHVLAPIRAKAGADTLHLHALPKALWIPALRGAKQQYGLITALQAADEAGAPPAHELFQAAQEALDAQGVFVASFANPENLIVANERKLADPPGLLLPPAHALQIARQAGFVQSDIVRYDEADESNRLPGTGSAVEQLNQLVCGPRRYALLARND